MKHFYPQGLPMTPSELLEATGRAISQEDRILALMRNYAVEWTAWELYGHFQINDWQLTSIRRSLFNLEKRGLIVQNGFTPGPKGKPVGKYIVFTGKLF